jgi:hypothetical protein
MVLISLGFKRMVLTEHVLGTYGFSRKCGFKRMVWELIDF